jgi:3-oxoacyl-[acyl-carrier-protein] synthase II
MMSERGVVITGAGCISPLGVHLEDLTDALAAGRSGVGEMAGFDASAFPCHHGAEVLDLDLDEFLESSKTYIDRTSAFALAACSDALRQAEWSGDDSAGLVLGTAWGCLDSLELFAGRFATGKRKLVPPLPFTHSYANAPNSLAAIEFGLRGFNACLTCGHAAGAAAIEYAARRIRLGKDARLLAGGSEALSECIFHAYCLREWLSPSGAARPYEASADGMILGECAGVFALEDPAAATERGARPLARLLGAAAANGADPEQGLRRSMRAALAEAERQPEAVDLIVGVGCGLPQLDAAEQRTVAELFGSGAPPLATVKALAGEAMGAGGPLSLAAALCALEGVPLPVGIASEPPLSKRGTPKTVLVNAADPSGAAVSLLITAA